MLLKFLNSLTFKVLISETLFGTQAFKFFLNSPRFSSNIFHSSLILWTSLVKFFWKSFTPCAIWRSYSEVKYVMTMFQVGIYVNEEIHANRYLRFWCFMEIRTFLVYWSSSRLTGSDLISTLEILILPHPGPDLNELHAHALQQFIGNEESVHQLGKFITLVIHPPCGIQSFDKIKA